MRSADNDIEAGGDGGADHNWHAPLPVKLLNTYLVKKVSCGLAVKSRTTLLGRIRWCVPSIREL